MKKVLTLLLALVFTLAFFAGCSSSDAPATSGDTSTGTAQADGPQTGGTFIVGIPNEPSSFNPSFSMDEGALFPMIQMFNSLVVVDADNNIVPDLAESWAYNEDFTQLTFNLKQGVKWHDGEDFTSADVKFTYDTVIANAGVLSANLASVSEITTPDDFTVVFNMETPDATLLYSLAWISGGQIIPMHIYEGTDVLTNPANMAPIGTGAFKFVSKDSTTVTLEANPDYFDGAPLIDTMIFQVVTDPETEYQMWKNGELDYMYNQIPASDISNYDNDENYYTTDNLAINRNYFTFNMNSELTSLEVRQAFNYALDRNQILEVGLKNVGLAAETYISPVYDWAINEDAVIVERDVERAKELLEEAGFTANEDGVYLTVEVPYFMFDELLVVAQANLLEAGIDIQLEKMELNTWMEKVFSGDYDVTFLGGDQGPDISMISQRIATGGGLNIAGYSNARVDELLALGISTNDTNVRAPYYQEIQQIMADELPLVFTNDTSYKVVVAKHIHGVPLVDDEVRGSVHRYSFAKVWMESVG